MSELNIEAAIGIHRTSIVIGQLPFATVLKNRNPKMDKEREMTVLFERVTTKKNQFLKKIVLKKAIEYLLKDEQLSAQQSKEMLFAINDILKSKNIKIVVSGESFVVVYFDNNELHIYSSNPQFLFLTDAAKNEIEQSFKENPRWAAANWKDNLRFPKNDEKTQEKERQLICSVDTALRLYGGQRVGAFQQEPDIRMVRERLVAVLRNLN